MAVGSTCVVGELKNDGHEGQHVEEAGEGQQGVPPPLILQYQSAV